MQNKEPNHDCRGGGSCQRHREGPEEGIRRGYREQPRLHQQQEGRMEGTPLREGSACGEEGLLETEIWQTSQKPWVDKGCSVPLGRRVTCRALSRKMTLGKADRAEGREGKGQNDPQGQLGTQLGSGGQKGAEWTWARRRGSDKALCLVEWGKRAKPAPDFPGRAGEVALALAGSPCRL